MPRYRLLVRGATVLVYGGRREVLAANEATASERSGDKHPGSREREGGGSGISDNIQRPLRDERELLREGD